MEEEYMMQSRFWKFVGSFVKAQCQYKTKRQLKDRLRRLLFKLDVDSVKILNKDKI